MFTAYRITKPFDKLLVSVSTLIIPILDYIGDYTELMLANHQIFSLVVTRKLSHLNTEIYSYENQILNSQLMVSLWERKEVFNKEDAVTKVLTTITEADRRKLKHKDP